jgi:hypothetical protein
LDRHLTARMPAAPRLPLPKSVVSVLRWLPALVPPLLIGFWMREYLVNVPFMDDFVWLPFYQKFQNGTFRWDDLMFVQMEHRLTVPAFLNWVFYHIKPGQLTLHNWSSFVQLCLIGWNLIFILRRTMPGLEPRWLVVACGSLALFSPTQYSTLLWCDCFSSYLAPLFITSAIAVLLSRTGLATKGALCVVLAVLCSISYGSGMLIWLLLVPLILWTDAIPERRQRGVFLAVWIVSGAVTMALYFRHLDNQALPLFSYQQGATRTFGVHLREFLADPSRAVEFILMFCGSMLGRGSFTPVQNAAFYAGALLALALAGFGVPLLRRRDDEALRSQTLPWIIIGSYTLAMGGMVAVSRIYAPPGLTGAVFNRYTVHTIFMVVGVVVLGVFWWRRLADAASGGWRGTLVSGAPFVLGLLAMQLFTGWLYGAEMMKAWSSSRFRDATCQLFQKAVPPPAIQGPIILPTRELAVQMDDIGLFRPAMPRDNRLDRFFARPRVNESSARVEELQPLAPGHFSASGIAFSRGQSRPVDGILLCYKDDAGAWRIFAVGQVKQPPIFVRDALYADMQYLHIPRPGLKEVSYGQWEIGFKSDDIPPGPREVGAWAFDYKRQSVAPMPGVYRVDGAKMTVERIAEAAPARTKK